MTVLLARPGRYCGQVIKPHYMNIKAQNQAPKIGSSHMWNSWLQFGTSQENGLRSSVFIYVDDSHVFRWPETII